MAAQGKRKRMGRIDEEPLGAPQGGQAPLWLRVGAAGVFLLALVVRLYPAIRFPEPYRHGRGPFGDTLVYHTIAFNLYKGHGYSATPGRDTFGDDLQDRSIEYRPAIFRAPAYPLFLSIIYRIWGNPSETLTRDAWRAIWQKVRLIQCVLDACVCLLVLVVVRTVSSTPAWMSLIAAALYAVCPYPIYYTRALLTETLTTFLMAVFLLISLLALKHRRLWRLGLAGVAFGGVTLSRPEYLLFAPVVALSLMFLNRRDPRTGIAQSVAYALGAVLVISPWTIRNSLVFKKPILISAGGWGGNLYFGAVLTRENWSWWWRQQYPDHLFLDEEERRLFLDYNTRYLTTLIDGTLEEINERDKAFFQLTVRRLQKAPLLTVKRWIVKIPRLWYLDSIPFYRDREASGAFVLLSLIVAAFAFVSAPPATRAPMALVWLLMIYLTVLLIPFHVESRYSVPLMPGLISLAALGLGTAWVRVTRW